MECHHDSHSGTYFLHYCGTHLCFALSYIGVDCNCLRQRQVYCRAAWTSNHSLSHTPTVFGSQLTQHECFRPVGGSERTRRKPTQTPHRKAPGPESTFLLGGDSTNHRVTVSPLEMEIRCSRNHRLHRCFVDIFCE